MPCAMIHAAIIAATPVLLKAHHVWRAHEHTPYATRMMRRRATHMLLQALTVAAATCWI